MKERTLLAWQAGSPHELAGLATPGRIGRPSAVRGLARLSTTGITAADYVKTLTIISIITNDVPS